MDKNKVSVIVQGSQYGFWNYAPTEKQKYKDEVKVTGDAHSMELRTG